MKFLFDLFPVILFFVAYVATDDIYLATAIIIPATFAQVLFAKFKFGKVDNMLWASLVLVCVMGGLTLLLHDKRFIMWKPTLLYWLFCVVLLLSEPVAKKNLIRAMMSKELALPESVWRKLNLAWAGFFALLGGLNLYVAYSWPEKVWAYYKLWGTTVLMLLFVLLQAVFLARHMHTKEDPGGLP